MTTIGKVFKWTVLIVIALLVLLSVSLWLFFPVEKAKAIAIEKGTELLEREIEIETASVSFWGGIGIQLHNIVIKNPPGFTKDNFLIAKTLDVKLQIIPLLFGDFAIDRLILEEPQINLEKQEDGKNNFTFTKLEKQAPPALVDNATPETKAVAAIVTFENIEVQNGTLSYVDDSSKSEMTLVGLGLRSTLTHPYDEQYLSSGDIAIRSFLLKNEINLPEINLSLKYESEFNTKDKSLKILSADLIINNIATTITGTVENLFDDINMKINIQSEQEDVENLLAFIPVDKIQLIEHYKIDGSLSFDVDVEYANNEFLYFGSLFLRNLSVGHNDFSGMLICKEALVDIKKDNLRFNITEGEFDRKPIKGHVTIDNFNDPFINGAFAGSLNLKYIEPFLPAEAKHTISGVADFNIKSSGKLSDIEKLNFHGEIKSENISYNSSFMLEPLDSMAIEMYFDNEIISIKKLTAQTKSGSIALDGRVTSLIQYLLADSISSVGMNPTIDARLRSKLELSVLNEILPPKGNPRLTGNLQIDLKLSGSVNDLSMFKPFGEIVIQNGSYNDALLPEKIESFNAKLTVLPDSIIVQELKAKFETSDASFQGKLINPFPFLLPIKNLNRSKVAKPVFVFTFKSSRFDVDKLFPEAVPGEGAENSTASLDSVSTIILPDIDGQGTFSIDTLIYSKVELTSLDGKVNIKNKKIECYDVKGNVYTGKIEGNTTIDLTDFRNPHYVGTFKAIQIEINDFASRFSKFPDMVFGKADMKGTYSADGWEPEQFLNSLTMNSTSDIRQGKMKLSGDIFNITNEFYKKFDSTLRKEQTIQNLFTNIIVKNGAVTFDNLKTKFGDIGDLEFGGFYHYNGAIAYDGKIKLTKELTNKIVSKATNVTTKNNLLGEISSLLTKKTSIGQITLPLHIGGTIKKPEFKIDVSSVFNK